MSIIKGFNKARNTTYVYESEAHWDKVKQQSRSKRKIIGKIDPETGNIVPTGPRGRKKSRRKKNESAVKKPNYKQLYEEATAEIDAKNAEIVKLREQVAKLVIKDHVRQGIIIQIRELVKC